MLQLLDITDKHWQDYIFKEPNHTIFHHPLWAQVISETYGYQTFAMVNIDDSGEIVAGLPLVYINSWLTGKRWISMPFSDQCKMLGRDKHSLMSLANGLIQEVESRTVPFVEIRDEVPSIPFRLMQNSYYFHQINLTIGSEKLFKNFHRSRVQANIKRAIRNGIVVTRHSDRESVEAFYKLHLLTRKKHGVPTQPKKYFRILWEKIICRDLGFVMLAQLNKRIVNAALFLHCNNTLVYKYAASDPTHLNLRGNHALIWEAIQWGCQNGYRSLCLGRTDLDNPGLISFKRGWGSTEQILRYSCYGNEEANYASGWKQGLIKNLIHNSPPSVGMLLGKILYKHVA